MLYNLHMVRLSPECLLNVIPWLTNILMIINYFDKGFKFEDLFSIMYIIATSNYLKASIDASRLSTYTREKIEVLKTRNLTKAEEMQDNMLGDWSEQTPFIVLKHINMSLFKNEYDDSNFVLSFIRRPKQQTLKHFEEA